MIMQIEYTDFQKLITQGLGNIYVYSELQEDGSATYTYYMVDSGFTVMTKVYVDSAEEQLIHTATMMGEKIIPIIARHEKDINLIVTTQ